MEPISPDLDRELASLDESTATLFKHTVLAMVRTVKAEQARKARPFAERIAGHPAIGTWPAGRNVSAHIGALRQEWDR